MRCRRRLDVLALIAVVALACSAAGAQMDESQSQSLATVYAWLPSMGGDITLRGIDIPFSMNVSDILDHGTGLSLRLESSRGPQGVYFDGTYFTLDGSGLVYAPGSAASVSVDVEFTEQMYEIGWIRDLWRKPIKEDQPAAVLDVEGYLGVRYCDYSLEVGFAGGSRAERSNQWVEPLLGLRATMPVAQKLAVRLQGDYGGFGIGSASDSTYRARTSALYAVDETRSIELGWQWMGVEADDLGEANTTELDYTANGMVFAFNWAF
jgi:hypothetical protein